MAATGLENANLAFGLVLVAGLSTAVGAIAVYFQQVVKLASKPVLAAGLGFSAGIMLYVSFIEIFVKSHEAFAADGSMSEKTAYYAGTACLFSGMVLMRLIAMMVHKLDSKYHCHGEDHTGDASLSEGGVIRSIVDIDMLAAGTLPAPPEATASSPQEMHTDGGDAHPAASPAAGQTKSPSQAKESEAKDAANRKLMSMGVKTAVAIAIHNFPEGLATFVATLADPVVGITLAVAIAIHNIPEGLCVALPVYYATGSRHKGFLWALLSGLSEPIGAILGWALLKGTGEDLSQIVYGMLFGIVSGMMIMIVVMELAPTGYRYDPQDKVFSLSVALGMAVMASSLCLFMS